MARAPHLPRGRPRLVERRARARGDHPGAAGGPLRGGHPAVHQPLVRAHPVPAGAHLPAERLRPRADGRGGPVPLPRRGPDPGPLPEGGRRAAQARPGGAGDLRLAQRAVGLPASRAQRRSRGFRAGQDDRGPVLQRRAHQRGPHARGQRARSPGDRGGGGRQRRAAPRDSARRRRWPHRRPGADQGRHRAAPPRARAADQGRDHPRDPPSGEEQPADRRRAAQAPGPAAAGARGQGGAGGGRSQGGFDRDRARDVVAHSRGDRRLRRHRRPRDRHDRRGVGGQRHAAPGRAVSACCPR